MKAKISHVIHLTLIFKRATTMELSISTCRETSNTFTEIGIWSVCIRH